MQCVYFSDVSWLNFHIPLLSVFGSQMCTPKERKKRWQKSASSVHWFNIWLWLPPPIRRRRKQLCRSSTWSAEPPMQTCHATWGRFNSRRSNTIPGQIDFGSIVHSRMTAKWPVILVVISQSLFISKNCTWALKCHHTFCIWPPKWPTLKQVSQSLKISGRN